MKKETLGRMLLLSLLCCGLGLSACKKDGEGDSGEEPVSETPPAEDKPVVEEPAEDEPVVEEVDAGTPEVDAGAAVEVDEALFIKGLYEVTCVQGRIEDTEKQKTIIEEVYARYGFDADSFKAAQASVGEKENVKAALKIRMEKCTSVEVAEGFAKAGDEVEGDEETSKKDEVKKPSRKFSVSSSYTARGMRMGDFNQGEIKISFTSRNTASGQFKIKGDGVLVKISLKGSISKDGSFNLRGSKGSKNNITVKGTAKGKSANGSLSGKINDKSVSSSFTANN